MPERPASVKRERIDGSDGAPGRNDEASALGQGTKRQSLTAAILREMWKPCEREAGRWIEKFGGGC